MQGKSKVYNKIYFLEEDLQDAIDELNYRKLLSDQEAEDIIIKALQNPKNHRNDISRKQREQVQEFLTKKLMEIFKEE